jgi:hypothetical protein
MLPNMVAKKVPAKKVATKKPVSGVDKNRPKNNPVTPPKKQDKQIPASFGRREEGLRKIVLGAMLGAKMTGAASKNIPNVVAKDVYKGTMREAGRGIKGAVPGGRIHVTQTPRGPDLRSTKVMTPPQLSAAQKGLATRASNISRVAADSSKPFVSQAIKVGGAFKTIGAIEKADLGKQRAAQRKKNAAKKKK